MVRTVVHNDTLENFTLKEGNAGVYRDIKVLQPNKKHIIELDTNATYREYVVVQNESGEKEYITSDDCLDNSKITITKVDDRLVFSREARDDSEKPRDGGEPRAHGFFNRLVNMFK